MEELKDRLNRMEVELSAVRAEASAMRKETAGVRRQNAMLRLAMIAAFAAWFLIGPAASTKKDGVQDVIRAKKLEIVDDAGNTRIKLWTFPTGQPLLTMFDDKAQTRAVLGVNDFGPDLRLYDEKGFRRADLGVAPPGADLSLLDDKGKVRAWLLVDADGSRFKFFDKDGDYGKIIWQAPPK